MSVDTQDTSTLVLRESEIQQAFEEICGDLKAVGTAVDHREMSEHYRCIQFSRNYIALRYGTDGLMDLFSRLREANMFRQFNGVLNIRV